MLVLTRKVNESILIGNGVRVTVARINGKQVRIGVEAPKNIPIYREELLEQDRKNFNNS